LYPAMEMAIDYLKVHMTKDSTDPETKPSSWFSSKFKVPGSKLKNLRHFEPLNL